MKTFKYIVGALLLTGLAGCEKHLDLTPISESTVTTSYNTATQLEAALVGAYETFQAAEYYQWDKVLFQDVRSDNHYAGGDNAEIYDIDWQTITATNSRLFENWSDLYNGVAKANIVLEKAPEVDDAALTEERRNEIMGEAYFLRAYHYYNLVTMFGGVPLVTTFIQTTDPDEIRVTRATEAEVYVQILADCKQAASLLPDTYGNDASVNKARATAGAANALAVKASLQKPNPDYEAALDFALAVEASEAGYSVEIPYGDLFDGNHYNNVESILEIQFLGAEEGAWGPQLHLPPSLSGDSWRKFVTPSHDLINAYEAVDDSIRQASTVLFEAVSWVDEFWGNTPGSTVPFAYKWKNAMGWSSTDRLHLLRFADIVLLKAEALAHLGRLDEAAAEVDKIRDRVELDPVSAAEKATTEAMLTTILNERRLELAQEGQRWDDLVRHGVVVETMSNLNEIDLRTGSAFDFSTTANDILLPIPQQELDRNPNLTQN